MDGCEALGCVRDACGLCRVRRWGDRLVGARSAAQPGRGRCRPRRPGLARGAALLQYVFSLRNLALGLLLFIRRPDDLVPRLLAVALLGTAATFNLPSHR